MSLRNTAVKSSSVSHYFGDLKQPLTEEEKLQSLKLRDWNLLIETHMRLAINIAGRYVSIGADSDEMVSSAMVGLCEGIDRIKKNGLPHDNITGYLVHYIHQYCSDSYAKETKRPTLQLFDAPVSDFKRADFDDTLEKIIKTDRDRNIINLRRQGFNDWEVAELIGVDQATATRNRHILLKRFENV